MRRHDAVEQICPAKVNLALAVGAPAEAGLHPIASWMVAVQFGDRLRVETRNAGSSQFEIRFQADAPAGGTVTWALKNDLTHRAHALLEQRTDRRLPVRLRLDKCIPAGAGLGGGSSNAAATLVTLNRLFDLALERDELIRLGQQLGSDVGFAVCAILGHPSVIVSGGGDRLEPLDRTDAIHLVLVLPPLACPTAEVYHRFDAINASPPPPDVEAMRQLAGPDVPHGLFNDLAESACAVRPKLRHHRQRLGDALGMPVHITGSGAAMFVVASSADEAADLTAKAMATTGLPVVATRTLGKGELE